MHYRPEIDGLRALAVVSVIAFHAGMPVLPAGYLGVDVFFVISGFVIGTLLKTEIAAGTFSLRGFFLRRVRRLAPALVTVIVVTLAASTFLLLPWELERLGASVLAVLGIFANFHFMKATDYFSPDAERLPLLHTWSLSIEEQFYLALPLLLLLATRLRLPTKWLYWALSAILVVSLMFATLYPYKLVATRYYTTETRIWELLAGVLLAYSVSLIPKLTDRAASVISALSLTGIIVSMVAFDNSTHAPFIASLIAVAGTIGFIAFAKVDRFPAKLLALSPVVAVGLASYSAYLWHQPVLALGRKFFMPAGPSGIELGMLMLLIACLSALSYIFIERPFRSRERVSTKALLLCVAGPMLFLAGTGFALKESQGGKKVYLAMLSDADAARVQALEDAVASRGLAGMTDDGSCRFWQDRISRDSEERFAKCSALHGKALVVVGDSHAMDLFNAFKSASGKDFIFGVSRGACGPLRIADPACPYQHLAAFVERHHLEIDQIYFTQSGAFFKDGDNFNVAAIDATRQYLKSLMNYSPVVWLGPQYEPMVRLEQLNPFQDFSGTFQPQTPDRLVALDRELEQQAKAAGITYVSKQAATHVDPAKDFIVGGQFTFSDQDHWSATGERIFGERLMSDLRKRALLK